MPKSDILAVIPALKISGSQTYEYTHLFAGYALIAYSIAAARQSKAVSRVVVATDDAETADLAKLIGAEELLVRIPPEIPVDSGNELSLLQFVLNWLAEKENYQPEIVVVLEPCVPVRPPDLVDKAIRILRDHPDASSVTAVSPMLTSPIDMWLVSGEDRPITPLVSAIELNKVFGKDHASNPSVYRTNHLVSAFRPQAVPGAGPQGGQITLPFFCDPAYAIEPKTEAEWKQAENFVLFDRPVMVWPGNPRRPMPKKVRLLLLDFDGVLTDNRVWVSQDGTEMVAANRSDSLGVNMLRRAGVETMVISMETNPVVAARCRKMNIAYIQGENEKTRALNKVLADRQIDASEVVYLGNDVNDLPCFPLVGWSVAVADAMPEVIAQADFVLSRTGGHAAVRELCDLIRTQEGKINP